MKQTNDFLIPDYFTEFHCKMGNCRAACCQGWPISVSMENYFRLLGMDCTPELRSRLDVGLRIADRPTKDQYARFNPRWDGDCPMRMEDGRCSIHAEAGEDALPQICRLYPRGIRQGVNPHELPECSCANSCEATLELFFNRSAPLSFILRRMTLDIPDAAHRVSRFETMNREQELRLFFIGLLQDRSYSLPQRIARLGAAVYDMDAALNAKDSDAVQSLLDGNLPVHPEPEHLPMEFALTIAENMVDLLDSRSSNLRERGEFALSYFKSGESPLTQYHSANEHFQTLFPEWEIFFEHMLVNHVFFDRFPYQDRPVTPYEEVTALCAVYTLLRFLALGWMSDETSADELIDTMAAAFRLVEHTDFDCLAARILREMDCTSPAQLHSLILL